MLWYGRGGSRGFSSLIPSHILSEAFLYISFYRDSVYSGPRNAAIISLVVARLVKSSFFPVFLDVCKHFRVF